MELRALSASVHTPFGKNLVKEAETLAKFKSRVDKVLTDLEKSPASQKSIDHQVIPADAYGTFDSAKRLATKYAAVHARLSTLSKIFGDQIEAMGLTALVAEKGYDGIDAEQAARLKEIQARVRKNYHAPEPEHTPGTPERSDAKDVGDEKA
ncbi:hypothetical protein [Streptomyces varsoviensis]|uniref:hypothetical protein n=1 Tax=Streptomyces varsoviensis TaxID=67373 RepID=UPI0006620C5F|nr:hypothetical protein [Streptomyces varsoviensis]